MLAWGPISSVIRTKAGPVSSATRYAKPTYRSALLVCVLDRCIDNACHVR